MGYVWEWHVLLRGWQCHGKCMPCCWHRRVCLHGKHSPGLCGGIPHICQGPFRITWRNATHTESVIIEGVYASVTHVQPCYSGYITFFLPRKLLSRSSCHVTTLLESSADLLAWSVVIIYQELPLGFSFYREAQIKRKMISAMIIKSKSNSIRLHLIQSIDPAPSPGAFPGLFFNSCHQSFNRRNELLWCNQCLSIVWVPDHALTLNICELLLCNQWLSVVWVPDHALTINICELLLCNQW